METKHLFHTTIFGGRPSFEFKILHTRGHWQSFGDDGMAYGDFRVDGKAGGLAVDITEVGASTSKGGNQHFKRVMVSFNPDTVKALKAFLNTNFPD